jgi:acetyl-CoA carboxylase biotin carboxyl carrier protein
MADEVSGSIDIKLLKRLQKFMEQGGLVEMEIEMDGVKVRLKKGGSAGTSEPQVVVVPANTPNGVIAPAAPAPAAPVAAPAAAVPVATKYHQVRAPMVGTLYRSPSPADPSFVNEGDFVKEGQTLCIIEAMKLMNEIKADKAGRIVKILVENGQALEYEQVILEMDTQGGSGPAA